MCWDGRGGGERQTDRQTERLVFNDQSTNKERAQRQTKTDRPEGRQTDIDRHADDVSYLVF